ncbi:uncharacterized protein LOC116201672 [Punica granatum]|uniref:PB1 domain-containing protein n=2 Tax=Punica granatum TaxID=22663 RepID=A0A218XX03_PUNGR|nr:uncharacterized protein LOC116201672 [Punica granatum]OWM89685.1 hypothetical protein CDL15_Pgr024433 [Punica granatum]PKI38820.1 hypothetical protein CRG98_040793 [Punica granatum]
MVGPSFDTCNLAPKPPRSSSTSASAIKFLCSYGGKILPRYPDGKLRYHGGETRVLAVNRSISFAELMVKMGELCGTTMSLRCQLPTEDLDALVSITSDEDLANLIEEYDRAASPLSCLKIRAFLSPPKSAKKISPPSSLASSSNSRSPSPSYRTTVGFTPRFSKPMMPKPVGFPVCMEKSAGKIPQHHGYGSPGHVYLVHNGNHWQ